MVSQAVNDTRSLVLWQSGWIAKARYSAACGGQTEAGLRDGVRYARVDCRYCRQRGAPRRGHGWGLCQEGAMAMAEDGRTAREILAKYYPDTEIRQAF